MHRRISFIVALALLASLATAFPAVAQTPTPQKQESGLSIRKQQVKELLKSLETKDPKPLTYINPQKYIQHNLIAANGVESLKALIAQMPANSAKINTIRLIEDGDRVVAHGESSFFNTSAVFDIFRFENGLIVEHWDNLQSALATPNPSGRTMTDGATEIKDLDKSAANKKLVASFVDDVLVNGKTEKVESYLDGENLRQHHPKLPDGAKALEAHLAGLGDKMKYTKVHKIIGEGNFVLTVSEGTLDGKPTSFYNLYRVENDKIAEQWETVETIPEKSTWRNENGKF